MSNHKLYHGVTANPVYDDNELEETAHIRISSMRDEENLNAHLSELMFLGEIKNDQRAAEKNNSGFPFRRSDEGLIQAYLGLEEEKKDLLETVSINSDTFKILHTSKDHAVNPMIYSTLTAAFPYALKATSPYKAG